MVTQLSGYCEKWTSIASDLGVKLFRRNRKSDPEIVRRNVHICDLRKQDTKKWSLGRLAKDFDLAKSAIQKILREEPKWRRLFIPYTK
jgi:hypothetical protein